MSAAEPDARPLYHGARAQLRPGDRVGDGERPVYCTPSLDAAIWAAELAEGDAPPRVYSVVPRGPLEEGAAQADPGPPPHLAMALRSRAPLEVTGEVTQWTHYHGTRADLRPGDAITPGHKANFGSSPRLANHVYFARTLDAAIWGAELAAGDGPGRVYIVAPTGPYEDDPNLTNARFRGNPTKSFRSRAPLRVVGEVADWRGHPPATVQRMREHLARLDRAGVTAEDD